MQQQASVPGSGNTIVQVVGDGNVVNATGAPHLTLTRFLARRQIRQDLDRLSPYTRSAPLFGRDTELAGLHAFLREPRALSVRVLTGGGGSGKTRLALELTEQATELGWSAGFVTRHELGRFFAQQNLSAWGWQHPTLIVVDYASEHAELLGRWLGELADRAQPPDHPLRMLLLERDASVDTGWWAVVFRSGGHGATVKRALLDPAEPVRIRPLVQVEDRLALLQAMLEARPDISLPLRDEAFRTTLMQLDWGGDPLFLMMAAMAMSQVGHARALALGRTDLADSLAEREAERIGNLARARHLSAELATHLAACVTLAQGMSRDDFDCFAAAEKDAIHRPSGGDVAELAAMLQEALPRGSGIAPVLPDLIGEALIVRTLPGDGGARAVLRCYAKFGHAVATTVIRCAQDFAPGASTPLQWLEVIKAAVGDDEAAIAALDASLPIESVVLRDFNLKVAQRLQELRTAREGVSASELAAALSGLSTAQSLAGKAEDALRSGRQAFDLYRELVAQDPGVFRPDLAGSIHNLANMLSDLDQREPALQVAQGAVDLYRDLAARRPEVFRPDLAMSLNSLANRLSDLGQCEPALQVAQEAVDIRRELAAQRPDVFRPDLARSLNNLANRLSDLGQREPALQAAQEAVDLYRELVPQRPDVFRPNLATSLSNLANRLSDLGQREPALQAAQEAVDLYRELVPQRPEVFRPDLAMSLNNLGNRLSDLGQREPALQAAQEAVDLYRELVPQRFDVFRPDLATTLNNLANRLSDLGQCEPALQAAREAVDIRRELAAQRPDVFRPNLATSLIVLAHRLGDLDQREAALHAAQEAIDLYRELAAQRPEVFRRNLATSLIVLALQTREVSDSESALPFAREAVATLLPEFERRPNVHLGLMSAMVRDYVELCGSANQQPDQNLLKPLLPYFTDKE